MRSPKRFPRSEEACPDHGPLSLFRQRREPCAVSARDILLQVAQVLTVLAPGAADSGRHPAVRRARATRPGARRLSALSRPVEAVPQGHRRSGDGVVAVLGRPDRGVHLHADGADPDPGADQLSAAVSDMGDILGGGLILTLGSFMIILAGLDSSSAYGGIGSSRAVMVSVLAEPTLILVFVGITLLAKAMLPFVVNHLLVSSWPGLLEPGASLPRRGVLHPAAGRNRPHADPLEHAYRSLHDRRGTHPRIPDLCWRS